MKKYEDIQFALIKKSYCQRNKIKEVDNIPDDITYEGAAAIINYLIHLLHNRS